MININISAWVAGIVIIFTAAIGWIIGDRVMQPLITYANSASLPATAYDVMNLVVGVYRPVMIVTALAGLVYIVYSSIPFERETQYGRY